MRRNLSLGILATVSVLTVVGSMSSAPAAEVMQDMPAGPLVRLSR